MAGLGEIYVWGAFMAGFAKRIPNSELCLLPVILLVAVMAIRLIVLMHRSSPAL